LDRAGHQQGAPQLERLRHPTVRRKRPVEAIKGLRQVVVGRVQHGSAPGGRGQRPGTVERPSLPFEGAKQRLRLVQFPKPDQGLDLVGKEGEVAGFPQPDRPHRGGGRPELPVGGGQVAETQLKEPEDRPVAQRRQPKAQPLGDRQSLLGGLAGDVCLPERRGRLRPDVQRFAVQPSRPSDSV
jgi:hypothetical protein